jgi:hypothetical protein
MPGPLTISYAGSAAVDAPFMSNTFPGTLVNVGDLMTVQLFGGFVNTFFTSIIVTGTGAVQGGGLSPYYQYYNAGTTYEMEMWAGIVTTTGSVTFTCNPSGQASSSVSYSPREFTTTAPTTTRWGISQQTFISQASGAGGTTVLFPSITPPYSGCAYAGYVGSGSAPTAGSTSGYEYDSDYLDGYFVYNPACSAAAQQPTMTQATTNDGYSGIGVIITAASLPATRSYVVSQAVKRKAFR